MTIIESLQEYARRIRGLRQAHADVSEPALAPAFQQLLQNLIPEVPGAAGLVIVPEFGNAGIGRPDIALMRTGAPARAFVELKAPTKPVSPDQWKGHDKRQYERFQELPCWAICNFSRIRLFYRGEVQLEAAIVPELSLDPSRSDAAADNDIAAHDVGPVLNLLVQLFAAAGQEPVARDAEHLATLLAHSSRLVRGIVQDKLAELHVAGDENHALLRVRQDFRDVLYAHPEAGGYSASDFDTLFSGAFAQTLAFGMLLVREASGEPVQVDAWQKMPEEHPLMRSALRVLTLPEVVRDIGVGFDVMRDTVNSFSPEILVVPESGRDPILYFYEDFLRTFDPQARERFGVYYTPVQVVRYMAGALDRALRDRLGLQGLHDPNVTILDPATGTGTFLLGVAERVREHFLPQGSGMAALGLQNLAGRMFGFELLVGPYAVAHYRLHHALSGVKPEGDEPGILKLPRLGVYLADTLAEPNAAAPAGSLGFMMDGIVDERREANRIKTEQPILAIIGNPPYRRLEEGENRTLVGNWMDRLWDDLKQPVRDAGKGGQLNTFPELSVAFWRWAIWKLFEADNAPNRGVVAYITNRKFLTGWPYAGLRKMMRERFDRIEIIDLRGDVRRGERAGVVNDQGVFNIQVGTAITVAIADGSKKDGELAEVRYVDSWTDTRFSRRAKLEWLNGLTAEDTSPKGENVERGPLDDLRPRPFLNGEWINIMDCFSYCSSGLESKRDRVVYGPTAKVLRKRIEWISSLQGDELEREFNGTSMNAADVAAKAGLSDEFVRQVSYRPFDVLWHYSHPSWNDRPRPSLQSVWGTDNLCLFTLPAGIGQGPAVWCHGMFPDRHAFRGSYGGYAFPLYDRRPDVSGPNIPAGLLQRLSSAYGKAVTAEQVFDVVLCLLSAESYTLRFSEDLEDVFPHVPFPHAPEDFDAAAALGADIRGLEAFARPPRPEFATNALAHVATNPKGKIASVEYGDGEITLCADGSGRITGIPQSVWEFSVSGYRILPRWLEARVGLTADLEIVSQLRDICGRITELIELMAQADIILERVLLNPLSREALGFDAKEPDTDEQ
jgi:hypothetical protein